MSDRVLCDKSDLVEIADAVRSFEGNTGLYRFSELKEKTKNALTQGGNSATLLADLNAVNGGTEATTVDAAVDNTEAHASSQEALIAQIATALEGKVAGGSGGTSAEACTVTIVNGMSRIAVAAAVEPYFIMPDGNYNNISIGTSETIQVHPNSLIAMSDTYIHAIEGSATRITAESESLCVIYVTGDATIYAEAA